MEGKTAPAVDSSFGLLVSNLCSCCRIGGLASFRLDEERGTLQARLDKRCQESQRKYSI
jgi:hypothetical protein